MSKRLLAVIDCETDPFQPGRIPEPFMWGFYDGEHYLEFHSTEALIEYLEPRSLLVYAHNGGRFDFHYIIPHLPPWTKFLQINGRTVEFKLGRAVLRDSYALIPIPLAEFDKEEIDYSLFEAGIREKHLDEIRKYLKSDCLNLYRMVATFIAEYGNQKTLAGAAMAFFLSLRKDLKDKMRTHRQLHEDLSPFYFGGRTQALIPGIHGATNLYDINSAYPTAMTKSHPFGASYRFKTGNPSRIEPRAFYAIEAESDGALPLRTETGLEYPVGTGEFYPTGHELIAGLATGTVRVTKHLYHVKFSGKIDMARYVQHFYRIKQKATKGSPNYIFAKLMLNTLYGKFGANPEHYRKYLSVPHENIVQVCEELDFTFEGPISDDTALVSKPLSFGEQFFYNLATAASITGYVRAKLWSTICRLRQQGKAVYYCDTDSIVTDGHLPTSPVLGDWSLEQRNRKTIIAGRKLYALQSVQGTWKTACKGADISWQEILKVTRGSVVHYRNPAPTFSLGQPTRFVERNIRRTA